MPAIRCAFICKVDDATIAVTKTGGEFLSLTAKGGTEQYPERFWITVFDANKIDDLLEKIKPGTEAYVEGTAKTKLDKEGNPFLLINGELVEVLYHLDARPKRRAQPAAENQAPTNSQSSPKPSDSSTKAKPPNGTAKTASHTKPSKKDEFGDELPF